MSDPALTFALGLLLCACSALAAAAPKEETMAEEAVCTQNLQAIRRALDAYQCNHGELPPHLSDLHPQYAPDLAIFHCPSDPSPGRTAFADVADPRLPISYLYTMSTNSWPFPLDALGPRRPGPGATWREVNRLRQIHFGDRVPAVRCWHHKGFVLNLTQSGEIHRSQGNWDSHPLTIAAMLDRMGQDLLGGPEQFARNWEPGEIEEYFIDWIDGALPPGLRRRLCSVAHRLSAVASALPASSQCDARSLTARFYRGAGQTKKALAAAGEALRLGSDHQRAAFLRADLHYKAGRKRGAPPVDAYLKAEMARLHIPGLSVAVLRDGKVILTKGYGLANVELSVPTTQRLKRALLRLAEGEADPGQFTPEAYATLLPVEASAFYQSLGTLKSFRLIEQATGEQKRTYRYRVAFGDTKWIQTFVLTEEGQIAELGVEPE